MLLLLKDDQTHLITLHVSLVLSEGDGDERPGARGDSYDTRKNDSGMSTMSIFKAKAASTCASQGYISSSVHLLLSEEITPNRPNKADPAREQECSGSVEACVEAADGQSRSVHDCSSFCLWMKSQCFNTPSDKVGGW